MKKSKKILDWWNGLFEGQKEKPSKSRNWKEIPGQDEILEEALKKSELFKPMINGRFVIEFEGIRPYYFNSYRYLGTDIHSKKRLLTSNKVIQEDYSSFTLTLCEKEDDGYDICEVIKSLEDNNQIGEVKIRILNKKGVVLKTIVIPDCEVIEIKAFRELSYKEEDNDILRGEIIVKHKQRKLLSDDEQRKG